MKQTYVTPEVDVTYINLEMSVLSGTGEDIIWD